MNKIFGLLVCFVAVFLLIMTGIAALASHNNTGAGTDGGVQDVQDLESQQTESTQRPFLQGQWGILVIMIVFIIGAVFVIFIKALRGQGI